MDNFYCYILRNKLNNSTYNGYTVNLNRRIRQHNQIIKGGAKFTKGNTTWEIYVYVTGFPNNINALQCEWKIKYPENKKRGKKYAGDKGRILGLIHVLKLNKWTNQSTILNDTFEINVFVVPEFYDLFIDLPENIKINLLPTN